MRIFLLFFILITANIFIYAQDDSGSLLDGIEEEEEVNYITNAFKSSRVINSHSIEMLRAGVLDFRILHRFGELSGGAYELFGLDQATMRMSFDYGITDNITAGIGRSTNKKEIDAFVKYRILQQSTGKRKMPISLIWASGLMVNGLKNPFPIADSLQKFSQRISYYHQIVIGRKFSERFSLQLSPTLLHMNLTESIVEPNDVFALGIGTRFRISKRVSINLDTYYPFNKFLNRTSTIPLSIGFDIETGGHVFQLHVTNSTAMIEKAFFTENTGSWTNGDIHFGFNISRVFTVKRKKE